MVQAVWSTADGRPLEVTNLQGDQASRLASHVDPLLVAFAPLWAVWPSPSSLLAAQAIALALGALPVFWLARKHLDSEWAATAFAAGYLLYPPVQWLALDDFHPVALACPLLLFAFWYLDEDRLGAFALVAIPAVLAKEEIGLVVAAMGLWYMARRRPRTGGVIAALGTLWSIVAIAVVIPIAGDGESEFYGRYDDVGGSPSGVVETVVTDPLHVLSVAFDAAGREYLAELLLPLAALSLLAPAALFVALPELSINLLSSTVTQTSIHFHYTAGVVPGVIAAAVFGSARLTRRQPLLARPLGVVVIAATLIASYTLGPVPDRIDDYRVTDHDRVTAEAVEIIAPDGAVSATNTLGAHLSERRRILSFPLVQDARWIAVDRRRPSLGDRLNPPEAPAAIAALRRDPAWRVVFDRDGVLVLRRR